MAKVNPIQLQKHLKGQLSSKEDLIARAQQQGAEEDTLSALEQPG